MINNKNDIRIRAKINAVTIRVLSLPKIMLSSNLIDQLAIPQYNEFNFKLFISFHR